MGIEEPSIDTSLTPGGASGNVRRAATAMVAAGCAPLVAAHLLNLAARPYYQFVIVVPLGVLLLWARETWDLRRDFALLHWAPLALLAGAFVGLAAATWWWSPWLGMLSTLLAILPCLWWRGGWEGWRAGGRGWLFACALLPLPFSLDEDVTRRLRTVTTDWTSRVLDEFGILHLSYANVIELPGKPLFIADACSGVHSLFVLLTAGLFLSMWLRRTLLHTVCLLGGTLLIVLIENVARLVIVAAALRWRRDLSEGPDHLLLGALLFAGSLLLVLSLDQLLMFFLPARRPGFLRRDERKGYYQYYQPPRETVSLPAAARPHPLQWSATLLLAAVFPVLGVVQVLRMPRLSMAQVFPRDLVLPPFGLETLPPDLAGFERVSYTTVKRVAGDPLGRDSQQWTYRRGSTTVLISLDYPYDGVHDLCECYAAAGWSIDDKRVLTAEELSREGVQSAADGPVALGWMHRPLYGRAVLLFSLADRRGHLNAIIKELQRGDAEARADRRFQSFGRDAAEPGVPTADRAPFVQFQLLARSPGEFSDSDAAALLQLYASSRDLLRARVLGPAAGASGAPGGPEGRAP